ncbi:hypothetical protein ACKLNR_000125 [Fusarium oxysporum f. sp. zingiberi]
MPKEFYLNNEASCSHETKINSLQKVKCILFRAPLLPLSYSRIREWQLSQGNWRIRAWILRSFTNTTEVGNRFVRQ